MALSLQGFNKIDKSLYMIAQLWKIQTDHEGESTIIFKVPLSELADVVKLNAMLQKELDVEIKISDSNNL